MLRLMAVITPFSGGVATPSTGAPMGPVDRLLARRGGNRLLLELW